MATPLTRYDRACLERAVEVAISELGDRIKVYRLTNDCRVYKRADGTYSSADPTSLVEELGRLRDLSRLLASGEPLEIP